MNQKFERIEKHLYLRQYQTAGGESRTIYYTEFTDWQGVRRKFPLGDELSDARAKLGELRNLNKGRYDWDAEKKKAEEKKRRAVIFSQWGKRYFADGLNPNPDMRASSIDREERAFALLDKFLVTWHWSRLLRARFSIIERRGRLTGSASLQSIVSFDSWESS
jgi:hypothetical protein